MSNPVKYAEKTGSVENKHVSYQPKGHIRFSDNGVYLQNVSRLEYFRLLQGLMCRYLTWCTGVVSTSKVQKTQPSENIFAYLFDSS